MKKGWRRYKLRKITTKIGSGATPKGGKKSYKKTGVSLIRSLNVHDGTFLRKNLALIDDAQANQLANVVVAAGDVLLNITGASIARCCIVPDEVLPARVNQHVTILRPDTDTLISGFLQYMLVSRDYKSRLLTAGEAGATRQALTKGLLEEFSVELPDIAEQRRIVSILDEAFAGIATAKAHAEQNRQNARALFDSHLHSAFAGRGSTWERVTLESLLRRGWILGHLDGNHGSDYPRKEEFIGEGVPYISANCIDDDHVVMERAKYLSSQRAGKLRKGIAKDGDVLFAHNATVGPVALLRTEQKKVILGTSLTYYRCNTEHVCPEYLAHYMRSSKFRNQYLSVMRQSTRNQVPITKQRKFVHVVPQIEEQRSIASALDTIFDYGQSLESVYTKKIAALDELKKSLLHQAFNGEF